MSTELEKEFRKSENCVKSSEVYTGSFLTGWELKDEYILSNQVKTIIPDEMWEEKLNEYKQRKGV